MSKSKLIGIIGACIVVIIVVIVVVAGGPTPSSQVNAAPPEFLQVGETYYGSVADGSWGLWETGFKVLEIMDDNWIVAEFSVSGETAAAWLNISQLTMIHQIP